MKTKQAILSEIEIFVRDYVVPIKPKGFVPLVYAMPADEYNDQDLRELRDIELLIEKVNPDCVGRITITQSFVRPNESLLGVALLPKKFKNQKILIVDVPFKPLFERVG